MKNDMLKNRFQKQLQKKKTENENEKLIVIKENHLMNMDILNKLTENKEELEILKKSSIDFLETEIITTLKKGEILETTFQKLSKQGSEESLYGQWLKYMHVSPTTAWRYRNRYKIIKLISIEKKPLVASLPYQVINTINEMKNSDEIIEKINNGIFTKEDIIDLIPKKIVEKEISKNQNHIFSFFEKTVAYEEKIKKFDIKKCQKAQIEIKQLQKLLQKYKEEIDIKIKTQIPKNQLKFINN